MFSVHDLVINHKFSTFATSRAQPASYCSSGEIIHRIKKTQKCKEGKIMLWTCSARSTWDRPESWIRRRSNANVGVVFMLFDKVFDSELLLPVEMMLEGA